jgi:hypothetical protein
VRFVRNALSYAEKRRRQMLLVLINTAVAQEIAEARDGGPRSEGRGSRIYGLRKGG